jgi:hypothetical protein
MEREAATWRHRLIMGAVFALPVATLSMGGMLPGLEDIMRGPLVVGALPLGWIVQAILAAVVQVRGARSGWAHMGPVRCFGGLLSSSQVECHQAWRASVGGRWLWGHCRWA